jgi:hypothetical protein
MLSNLYYLPTYSLSTFATSVSRKTVQNALRYVAHSYGATVLSVAKSKKPLMAMVRSSVTSEWHVNGTDSCP